MVTTELVFGSPRLTDPDIVGHKFARQAILRRAGFPVPEFFCVPAGAFPVTRQDITFPDAGDAERWAALRRAEILERGMPPALATAIVDGFDRLVGRDGLAAVRACVVAVP